MLKKHTVLKHIIHDKKITTGQIALLTIMLIAAIMTAIPILFVFVSAFTDENVLAEAGYGLFPSKLSLNGFNTVFKYEKQLLISYGVTIFVAFSGTVFGLLVMSMYGYVLTRRDFPLRKFLTVFLIIPMLFNGGQLSAYIVYTSLYHMKDNILLLILPQSMQTLYVIILRTYIVSSVPRELMDAAKIDGAGEYTTFFRIVFPLMKPALASVGFMTAAMYWNDWQNALLFMESNTRKPLQLLLIDIQKSIETILSNRNIPPSALAAMQGRIPQYSATMATVVVVIVPIVLAYPFFQKYFIKGLTLGSVKE